MTNRLLSAFFLAGLFACSQEAVETPAAIAMTDEAVGHYCQMTVLEHDGPKAQVHIAGFEHPLWFAQVRDAIAYLRSAEETGEVRAIYVNDMDKAESWAAPGISNWIAAAEAHFVIDSKVAGGMGAPEAIPFGSEQGALNYSGRHGGRLAKLSEIPDEYVLAPVYFDTDAQTDAPAVTQ